MRRAVSTPSMRKQARVVPRHPRALAVLQPLVARRASPAQVARLRVARLPVARLSAVVGMAAAQVARLQVARLPAVRFPVAARVAAAVMLACQTPLLLSRMSPLVDRAAVVRAPVEGEAPGAAASRPSGQDRTALPWRASRTAQSPSRQEPPVPRRHIPARPDTSSPEQRRAPAKAMAPGAGRRPPAPW